MTSSFDVNRCPPRHFFNFENKEKSLSAKSGKYGGCFDNSNFNSIIFAIETAQVCTCGLSWWKRIFFFFRWGRFFLVFFSTGAITTHNTLQLSFVLFQVIGVDGSVCIPKNRGHDLAGRFHRPRLLRSTFAFKNPLFWLFLCFWSVVVYVIDITETLTPV